MYKALFFTEAKDLRKIMKADINHSEIFISLRGFRYLFSLFCVSSKLRVYPGIDPLLLDCGMNLCVCNTKTGFFKSFQWFGQSKRDS